MVFSYTFYESRVDITKMFPFSFSSQFYHFSHSYNGSHVKPWHYYWMWTSIRKCIVLWRNTQQVYLEMVISLPHANLIFFLILLLFFLGFTLTKIWYRKWEKWNRNNNKICKKMMSKK
jgi:hypothetical protein